MASVFLSYDREDVERGRRVARALEKAGHFVWWDRRIKSGAQYGPEIDEALKRSDAVVVLWSQKSIESAWVRDEAAAGRDNNKLVPARIDPVDPPLGFRQYQTTDLTRWKGRRSPEWDEMIEAIAAFGASPKVLDAPPAPISRQPKRWKFDRPLAVAVALLAIIAVGLIAWKFIGESPSVPVVAVAAADPSPASQALARDLLVKLGTLQTARPNSIDLISRDDTDKEPALVFKVGLRGGGEHAGANLALSDAEGRSLLWAKDFRDPNGNAADISQQLAYTAAHVLRCAVQAMDPAAGRLSREALKTYLNACAAMPDASLADVIAMIPGLRELVRDVPKFRGAWAILLIGESFAVFVGAEGEAMRQFLVRHIAEARKIHPHLPEAYMAEVVLTPGAQFLKRSRLLNQGVERNPDSAVLRSMRHSFLASVGRTEDALRDARRAMELDPLAPDIRYGYIMSLGSAGRMDEALAALKEAERLWPGATSVRVASYQMHFRAGDPREALKLIRAGVLQEVATPWLRTQETLLQARIDRSPENVERAIRMAAMRYDQNPQSIGTLAQTLAEFGRKEDLFRILMTWRRMDLVTDVTDVVFAPAFADIHKDRRFMQVAKRLGLIDYWRATGKWPDFCSRTDLSYDCKTEAAKLAA